MSIRDVLSAMGIGARSPAVEALEAETAAAVNDALRSQGKQALPTAQFSLSDDELVDAAEVDADGEDVDAIDWTLDTSRPLSDPDLLMPTSDDALQHAGVLTHREAVARRRAQLLQLRALCESHLRRLRDTLLHRSQQHPLRPSHDPRPAGGAVSSAESPGAEAQPTLPPTLWQRTPASTRGSADDATSQQQTPRSIVHAYYRPSRKEQMLLERYRGDQSDAAPCTYVDALSGTPCAGRALPLTTYCLQHILHDGQQRLYRPCSHVTASGEACTRPVLAAQQPAVCSEHVRVADFAQFSDSNPESDDTSSMADFDHSAQEVASRPVEGSSERYSEDGLGYAVEGGAGVDHDEPVFMDNAGDVSQAGQEALDAMSQAVLDYGPYGDAAAVAEGAGGAGVSASGGGHDGAMGDDMETIGIASGVLELTWAAATLAAATATASVGDTATVAVAAEAQSLDGPTIPDESAQS